MLGTKQLSPLFCSILAWGEIHPGGRADTIQVHLRFGKGRYTMLQSTQVFPSMVMRAAGRGFLEEVTCS